MRATISWAVVDIHIFHCRYNYFTVTCGSIVLENMLRFVEDCIEQVFETVGLILHGVIILLCVMFDNRSEVDRALDMITTEAARQGIDVYLYPAHRLRPLRRTRPGPSRFILRPNLNV